MKKTVLAAMSLTAFGFSALTTVSAQAAMLNNGDTLTITAGVNQYDNLGNFVGVASGSWFSFDVSANISGNEQVALSQGTQGLVIGVTTSAGAYHVGYPVYGDTNAIDAPWGFFGSTGSHYLTTPATGGTGGLNMSGWTMAWLLYPAISLGTGAWTPLNAAATGMAASGYANGVGVFSWDGVYGHAYNLDYTATVSANDPTGLRNTRYALHLTGTVQPVPAPAAVWLLGSGLLGLFGMTRRRKKS